MPLSRAFQRLVEGGLIAPLPLRPPPHPTPPGFMTNLHYAYHQRAGHDINSCVMMRQAIQDLIDQGLVDLGCPAVTTDSLLTHDTRAVPPPTGSVHSVEFSGDKIFMMGWDGMERLHSRSVYTQTQILVDTPLASKSLGHSDLSQMRFPNRLQFHPYTCSMFRP